MENTREELYEEEETLQIIEFFSTIRHFLITAFYCSVIIINYIYTPGYLWYPWVLGVWFLYTVARLIYPFSLMGYLGKKKAQQVRRNLEAYVDLRENEREEFLREKRKEVR